MSYSIAGGLVLSMVVSGALLGGFYTVRPEGVNLP